MESLTQRLTTVLHPVKNLPCPTLSPRPRTVVCRACDLLIHCPPITQGSEAACPRCGEVVGVHEELHIPRLRAMILAAAFLLLPSFFLPMLSLEMLSYESHGTLIDTGRAIWVKGFPVVASLLIVFGVVLPCLRLLGLWIVLTSVQTGRGRATPALLHIQQRLDEWGMPDIHLLGLLVAVVKLRTLAELHAGPGIFCFAAFLVLTVTISRRIPYQLLWRQWIQASTGRHI